MISNLNRSLSLIAGAERSGKTYYAETLAALYAKIRGPVLVYNAGRDTDFKGYEFIEIVEPDDIAYELYSSKESRRERSRHIRKSLVTHFILRGKRYRLEDFNKIFTREQGSAKLKMHRITDQKLEEAFFDAVLRYLSGCLFIMDDSRFLTRDGVKKRLGSLLNKKNHAGQFASWKRTEEHLLGVDIIMIFHNISKVSVEVFDYITHIILFKSNQRPKKNIDNDEVAEVVNKAYDYLRKAPDFTAISINVKGDMRGRVIVKETTQEMKKLSL